MHGDMVCELFLSLLPFLGLLGPSVCITSLNCLTPLLTQWSLPKPVLQHQ